MSPDTIAPTHDDPQTRNRYAYVLNNPLKYTDPTGHCTDDGSDGDNTADCEAQLRGLGKYGITITDYHSGLWSLKELKAFLASAGALGAAFGWSAAEFRKYVGPVHAGQSADWRGTALVGSPASALASPGGGMTTMTFFQESIHGVDSDDPGFFLKTAVHELAHAMDFTAAGAHSLGMMAETGSSYRDPTLSEIIDDLSVGRPIGLRYVTSGTTPYGSNNHAEDWAESVAAYVYDPSLVNQNRINYIANLYGPTGRYGGGGGSAGKR